MSVTVALLPVAHAGHLLVALPFFGPMLMVVGGLLFLMWRDRRDGDDATSQPKGSSA